MTLTKIVIIAGPTASGKSALALEIAERAGGRIVSADSGAVYRRLDIGTAKPTAAERSRVPHYLIDVVDPGSHYNAMAYAQAADGAIREVAGTGALPIVVGGTGLYLKALVFGILDMPHTREGNAGIRESLEMLPTDELRQELGRVDAVSEGRIGANDRVRLIRALEIYRLTGIPKSELTARHAFSERRYDALTFCLSVEREALYRRVNARVERMIADGLVSEVRGLLGMGYGPQSPGFATIGYREIAEYLEGRIGLDEAVSLIKRNSRRYAKRQMTWFRAIRDVHWVQYPYDVDGLIRAIRAFMAGRSPVDH